MELPVVTTSLVADGLTMGSDAPPLWIAQNAEQFADRIAALLAQPQTQAQLAADGRKFVEKQFSWSRSAEKLEEMCLAAVAGTSGHAT